MILGCSAVITLLANCAFCMLLLKAAKNHCGNNTVVPYEAQAG